jgi:hypothetical protein
MGIGESQAPDHGQDRQWVDPSEAASILVPVSSGCKSTRRGGNKRWLKVPRQHDEQTPAIGKCFRSRSLQVFTCNNCKSSPDVFTSKNRRPHLRYLLVVTP